MGTYPINGVSTPDAVGTLLGIVLNGMSNDFYDDDVPGGMTVDAVHVGPEDVETIAAGLAVGTHLLIVDELGRKSARHFPADAHDPGYAARMAQAYAETITGRAS